MKTFNVFQVAGIWKSEEIHTRIIAELLNPNSEFHEMGTAFLQKFLDKLGLEKDLSSKEFIQVKTEVHTIEGNQTDNQSRNRRIDMVIETTQYYLPFEVKIWAGDQESQLYDYYQYALSYAKEHGKKEVPCIYYLTPDGHAPSDWSIKSSTDNKKRLEENQFHQLSFKDDILPWLEECIKIADDSHHCDVREIMKQLRDNIALNFQLSGDILDTIQQQLSDYHVVWTECTDKYRTLTLKRAGKWEAALRIQRYYSKVKLFVICGYREDTEDGLQINYAGKRTFSDVETLLEDTFDLKKGLIDTDQERAWNWLKEPIILEKDFKQEIEDKIFAYLKEGRPWSLPDTSEQNKSILKS
ncbi:PD-(D/E)XK nuclease family protein [Pseudoflavonifractor phocaeensis]|uniref:PDDEXK-like family protein n=1 Tax=Pseudoflavonifractor phocaeensis TaxID=1870988 RepID=UPI0019572053|nr:PD-(D/E)XK nuclease family protein [Pseudoflavonifractor phocaeensis]MBM6724844.1 PD-(D/E)XK nuclease family protein [Pseudoflavonifractor phocaeensis]